MNGGRILISLAVALLAACGSESDQAQPTTTSSTTTTTTTAPRKTATTKPAPARKAATTTTAAPAKPGASASDLGEGDEEEEISVEPSDVEPYLLQPNAEWRQVSDRVFATGPMNLNQAVADETEDGGSAEEAREFFERIGFMAGYSRAWERVRTADDRAHDATHVFAYLYFFSSPQGAKAYLDHDADAFEESTGGEAERISAADIPGSRAWAGKTEDGGSIAAVLFTRDNFYARVVCTRTVDPSTQCRTWATQHASAQYKRLQ